MNSRLETLCVWLVVPGVYIGVPLLWVYAIAPVLGWLGANDIGRVLGMFVLQIGVLWRICHPRR